MTGKDSAIHNEAGQWQDEPFSDSRRRLRIHQPEKDGAVGWIDGDENLVGGRGIGNIDPVCPQTHVEIVGLNPGNFTFCDKSHSLKICHDLYHFAGSSEQFTSFTSASLTTSGLATLLKVEL